VKASGWLLSAVSRTYVTSRASSLQQTSCCDALSSSSVVSRTFSALCVYSKFGHRPHPLGYRFAKFRFCGDLHCWARWTNITYSINHSLSHSPSLFDAPGTEAFASEFDVIQY